MEYSIEDRLTQLPARECLEKLKERFQEKPAGDTWSLLMIDIDHFKLINDIYGHLSGDEILKAAASILSGHLRKQDVMLRYGGDEFLGVLFSTTLDKSLNFAERIMEEIRRTEFPYSLQISISIGISESLPSDRNLHEVIHRADKALYQAKDSGRARISFYSESDRKTPDDSLAFSHFIGRQQEIRKLRQLLDEAITESSRLALITGEAGVGKTRLIQELYHYVHYKKIGVLSGACDMMSCKEPYATIIEPLREFIRRLPPVDMDHLIHAIPPLHPATHDLFPMLPAEASSDASFYREERLKFRIFEDVLRIFRHISSRNPVFFFIDDLQWITRPDWELLTYLIRGSLQEPVLFCATCRKTSDQSFFWSDQLNQIKLTIPFLLIPLTNLSEQELNNLVMFAFHDPNIPPEIMSALYRQSGGNPFFVREMIKTLFQHGCVSRGPAGEWIYHSPASIDLPESLTQLIASRLEPIDGETRKLLRIAALSVGSFTLKLLCRVVEQTEMSVAESLETPLRMGIIQEESAGGRSIEYRFTHDTVRSYLFRELSAGVKTIYHRRIAEYYESLYAEGNDELVIPMAYHYNMSGIDEKSRDTSLLAARQCERRQANRDAIFWLEKHIAHIPHVRTSPADTAYAYQTLGKLCILTGRGEDAMNYLDLALNAAGDDENRASIVALKASNLQRMSRYPESRTHYIQASNLTPNDLKRADYICSLAFLDILEGRSSQAEEHLNRAEALIRSSSENTQLKASIEAAYFTSRGILAESTRPGQESIDFYQHALDIYRQHDDSQGEAVILNNMCEILSRSGDFEKALDVLHQAEDICLRLDDALSLAIAHFNQAEIYSDLNQLTLAKEYYERYMRANVRIGNELGNGYARLGLGILHSRQGNLKEAELSLREARDLFDQIGSRHLTTSSTLHLIRVLSEAGKVSEAAHEMARVDLHETAKFGITYESEQLLTEAILEYRSQSRIADSSKIISNLKSLLANKSHLDFYTIMQTYYYLMEILLQKGHKKEALDLAPDALSTIRQQLDRLSTPLYRSGIRSKGIIPDLIKQLENLGFDLPG